MTSEMRIPHPEQGRIRAEVKRLSARSLETGRGTMLMAVCPPGFGKTFMCDYLCALDPPFDLDDRTVVHRFKMDIPLNPTPLSLGEAALTALGHRASGTKADAVLDDLVYFLKECRTESIFIDNVHDIVRKRGILGVLDCAAWIRKLHDRFAGLIVLLGTKQCEPIVDMEPQLRRRSPRKLRCNYLSISTTRDVARTKRFLHEVDERLPLAKYSGLQDWALQIVVATFGIQDYLFKMLEEAVPHAAQTGREMLTLEDLAFAFDAVLRDAGTGLNPFVQGGLTRMLDQAGEPFHKWNEMTDVIPGRRVPQKNAGAG